MTEVKKAFDGLISKPASAVERTNQLEETSMNTSKTKRQRKEPVASLNTMSMELPLTLLPKREDKISPVTAGRYLLCIYLLTVSS